MTEIKDTQAAQGLASILAPEGADVAALEAAFDAELDRLKWDSDYGGVKETSKVFAAFKTVVGAALAAPAPQAAAEPYAIELLEAFPGCGDMRGMEIWCSQVRQFLRTKAAPTGAAPAQAAAEAHGTEALPHVIEERNAYASELARCRDAFPIPEPGTALDDPWQMAMGDPLRVADYVVASLANVQPNTAAPAVDQGEGVADNFRGSRRRDAAEATLQRLCYEWHGGELWKPPLGKSPAPAAQAPAVAADELTPEQIDALITERYGEHAVGRDLIRAVVRATLAQRQQHQAVQPLTDAERMEAARYRAIRDGKAGEYAICEWIEGEDGDGFYEDARAPEIVDAAIDAAMGIGATGGEADHG